MGHLTRSLSAWVASCLVSILLSAVKEQPKTKQVSSFSFLFSFVSRESELVKLFDFRLYGIFAMVLLSDELLAACVRPQ